MNEMKLSTMASEIFEFSSYHVSMSLTYHVLSLGMIIIIIVGNELETSRLVEPVATSVPKNCM